MAGMRLQDLLFNALAFEREAEELEERAEMYSRLNAWEKREYWMEKARGARSHAERWFAAAVEKEQAQ